MKVHSKMHNEGKYSSQNCNINMKQDMNSLEDVLSYFGLSLQLQELEKSLEEVRNCKRAKEEHEHLWKKTDKEMQKLSLKYHPDKVKSRGGSIEEITEAQKIQSILNKTRTVLNILTGIFLDDISIDHKYEFYTALSLSTLGNEKEIKNHTSEVQSKIGKVSEIKQKYIISEIRSFLICSRRCIAEYFEKNEKDFEKYRDLALFHLKCCIKGYEKLCLEIEEVEKESKFDKLHNIGFVMQKMRSSCNRELALLKELQKVDEKPLKSYNFFCSEEPMDSFLVLPFVSYVNVFLMCSVVMKNVRSFGRWGSHNQLIAKHNNELFFLMRPFHLVSYYSGNHCKEIALEIIKEKEVTALIDINKDPMPADAFNNAFNFVLKEVTDKMEDMFRVDNYDERSRLKKEGKFKVDNYNEGSEKCNSQILSDDDITECMTKIHVFGKKNETLSQDVDKLKIKREVTKKTLEEPDTLLQEIKKKTEKVADLNMKLNENISRASEKCFDIYERPGTSSNSNFVSESDGQMFGNSQPHEYKELQNGTKDEAFICRKTEEL